MDSCDELEDRLLGVIQKSVEQRITLKEITTGRERSTNLKDQTVQKVVVLREKSRLERMQEPVETRWRRNQPATARDASEGDDEGKENASPGHFDRKCDIRSSAKSALKRLGNLYSDGNISSPIHRTEADFCIEPVVPPSSVGRPEAVSVRSGASRPEARSARLAALANTINQWEDDLSHPVIVKHEAQGFARCESRQHLIYDYSEGGRTTPAQCLSPSRKRVAHQPDDHDDEYLERQEPRGGDVAERCRDNGEESQGGDRRRKRELAPGGECGGGAGTGEPVAAAVEEGVSRWQPEGRLRREVGRQPANEKTATASLISPRKVLSPCRDVPSGATRDGSPRKATAVMEMAAAIEESCGGGSPTKGAARLWTGDGGAAAATAPQRDPAEMSLAERKALFERQGGRAVLPKAPFAMSVPRSALHRTDEATAAKPPQLPSRGPQRAQLPGKAPVGAGVGARAAIFERRRDTDEPRDPVREEIAERHREVEMLRNRHRARIEEAEVRRNDDKATESKPTAARSADTAGSASLPPVPQTPAATATPKPQPPPPTAAAAPTPPPPPPPMPLKMLHDPARDSEVFLSPRRRSEGYPDVKRIRVSPPKPGRLYPSISDIETETESELPESDRNPSTSEESSFEDDSGSVSSLGGRIVKFASTAEVIHSTLKRCNESRSSGSSTVGSSDESKVLQEIDDFLDEALKEPSPKRSRDSSFDELVDRTMVSYPSGSCRSTSFEFSSSDGAAARKSTECSGDTTTSDEGPFTPDRRGSSSSTAEAGADGGPSSVQLVHTISLYRKQQQNNIPAKPVSVTIRREEQVEPKRTCHRSSDGGPEEEEQEEELVAKKIHDLLIDVSRQQTVIAQASQALNLCCSTVEFSGSTEQIEGERLLLIATLRRQACLHELQRLRVEKRLRPGGGPLRAERGNLTIERITLPVKMDAIHQAAREEKCQHVVCLVRCGATVLATEMTAALPKNLTPDGRLRFNKRLSLDGLYGDFTATVEVYTLAARSKELLPHDIKYHIAQSASNKKDKLRLTPKKGAKSDSRFLVSAVESPGGPQAVRSPAFAMAGFIVFSLRELSRTHFTLNKVPYGSVVEGTIDMKISCDMSVDTEHRGFLTMFEDVSGFGAWHRRWCLLKGDSISYWKYPEDEEQKIALDTIDLTQCATKEVGLVSRDICARPNTFLLEIVRPSRPGDAESLILKSSGDTTTIRHLLSADRKEDRLAWCGHINRTLMLLRAWGKRPHVLLE